MELLGRKIKYVKLHGGDAFIPGIGGLGSTLPPQNKALNMVMTHTREGVHVNVLNGKSEAIIPWANIQLAAYLPEEKLAVVAPKPVVKQVGVA